MPKNVPITDKQRRAVIEWKRSGATWAEMIERSGLGRTTIAGILRTAKVKLNPTWSTEKIEFSPAKLDGIIRDYRSSEMTIPAIAKKNGCSAATISKAMRRAGVPSRAPTRERRLDKVALANRALSGDTNGIRVELEAPAARFVHALAEIQNLSPSEIVSRLLREAIKNLMQRMPE